MTLKKKPLENILGKGDNAVKQHFLKAFSPFPARLSTCPKKKLIVTYTPTSALTETSNLYTDGHTGLDR